MVYDLYSLPQSFKPCEPVDTTDTRYFNQTHASLVNSLKNAPDIELYNKKEFNKLLLTFISPFTYKYTTLQYPNEPSTLFPSILEHHKKYQNVSTQTSFRGYRSFFFIPYSPLVLYKSLVNTDCFFFIQYTSENIFKLCWFLVKVNYAETVKLKTNSLYTENHHADFPSRHSKDNQLCVDVSWY